MATGGSDQDFNSDCGEHNYFDKGQERSDRSPANEADNENKKPEISKSDENPFSFKRFLQAPNGSLTNGHHRPPTNRLSNLDLAHDLPDFVQDHYNTTETEVRASKLPLENDLPDFAKDMTSSSFTINSRPSHSIGARPKTFSQSVQLAEGIETQSSLSFTNFISKDIVDNCVKSLPDFLSDSGIGPSHTRDNTSNERDCLASLEDRNSFLMKKLEELNKAYQMERERGRKLNLQLQEVQKYEKEDIQMLEKMVQQAESNLTSTNRQLKNEKEMNAKLHQQIASLNSKIELFKNHAVCMKCGNKYAHSQIEMASQQIAVAAIEAEKLLKQLLVGVDNLKAVSNLLASCNMNDLTRNDDC